MALGAAAGSLSNRVRDVGAPELRFYGAQWMYEQQMTNYMVPPEAQYAWVVFDYRERARRYDFLKAGWSTNLEAAILDAEGALAEMQAAGKKRR